ncbi:hypothetical protein AGABI2DRAFT_195608 [Agaricus bisporus var. bisporus H97]|uniref:hypothetical protein n=1 Tax=Agaricus bisporus var. bisporus (strain H97 / ATCC MYA-4626 / FGSC 10389) TaxID=936046 RepID=UPI00029F594A|nr:hypothetical protein AGABI2DRAFT_195608 [Agaricus bisporus var. bisporus H97]EKV42831.1 hypothetical protein AGABI2DRAFT_195608 [Agaricus bisporus var. bisporus H97]
MTTVSQNPTKYDSRYVKSADGTEIYADACGNRSPNSPVLVLIHGAFMVKGAFDPIIEDPKWTSSVFFVRYDTRGHGRSGKSTAEEAWESKRFSEDFEAVCSEFNVREAYVLGWSIGSAQFVDIMSYNTTVRINGFISVAGAIYLDPSVAKRTARPLVFECAAALTAPSSTDVFQEGLLNFLHLCSDKLPTDLFRVLLEGMVLQPRAAAVWVHKRKQDPEKMLEAARAGKLPLLAIGGGKDKFLDEDGFKATYEELGWQRMTYRHLEDADHVPWVSSPEEFRDVVLAWLRELQPSAEETVEGGFFPRLKNLLNWMMSR